jgi:hypothetical protein
MRAFVTACVLALGLAAFGPARAQDADIRSVISSQIEAFKADDFETAFGFASPGIKRMFGTPDRFGQMVRSGYPMVWRPAEVRFGALETRGGRQVQPVLVTDASGAVYVLDYEMIEMADGWRIDGVTLRRGDLGA